MHTAEHVTGTRTINLLYKVSDTSSCEPLVFHFNSLDMHQQIEELESQLRKSNNRLSQIEHELIDSKVAAETEVLKLRDELNKLRDRYDR